MGPPEFTGGNPPDPVVLAPLTRVLQWGRRNSPAETTGRVVHSGQSDSERASMGPPEFTGGNRHGKHVALAPILLQWGRRNSPAETP